MKTFFNIPKYDAKPLLYSVLALQIAIGSPVLAQSKEKSKNQQRRENVSTALQNMQQINLGNVADDITRGGVNLYVDGALNPVSTHKSYDAQMHEAVRFYMKDSASALEEIHNIDSRLSGRDSIQIIGDTTSILSKVGGYNKADSAIVTTSPFLLKLTRQRQSVESDTLNIMRFLGVSRYVVSTNRDSIYSNSESPAILDPVILNLKQVLVATDTQDLDVTVVLTKGNINHINKNSCFEGGKFSFEISGLPGEPLVHTDCDRRINGELRSCSEAIIEAKRNISTGEAVHGKQVETSRFTIHISKGKRSDKGYTHKVRVMDKVLCQNYAKALVVYPDFDPIAPVPSPIIYISENASEQELIELFTTQADKIRAYNNLFDQNLLPTIRQIDQLIEKFSSEYPGEAQAIKNVSKFNRRELMKHAYLSVKATGRAIFDGTTYTVLTIGKSTTNFISGMGELPQALGTFLKTAAPINTDNTDN